MYTNEQLIDFIKYKNTVYNNITIESITSGRLYGGFTYCFVMYSYVTKYDKTLRTKKSVYEVIEIDKFLLEKRIDKINKLKGCIQTNN